MRTPPWPVAVVGVEFQNDFRAAAQALDLPVERIGTHSCRVACATWLYQAGYSIDYIKRHARWLTNAVHVYLWEGAVWVE